MAAQSKVWVCDLSLAGLVGSNLAWGTCVSLMCVVYCQGEVSATGCSLPQRSPAEGECVSDCERETLIIKWKFRPAVALPLSTPKFCDTTALPMFTSILNSKTVIVNLFPACIKSPTSNYFIFTPHHPLESS